MGELELCVCGSENRTLQGRGCDWGWRNEKENADTQWDREEPVRKAIVDRCIPEAG